MKGRGLERYRVIDGVSVNVIVNETTNTHTNALHGAWWSRKCSAGTLAECGS